MRLAKVVGAMSDNLGLGLHVQFGVNDCLGDILSLFMMMTVSRDSPGKSEESQASVLGRYHYRLFRELKN